jgi:hypothetical protein
MRKGVVVIASLLVLGGLAGAAVPTAGAGDARVGDVASRQEPSDAEIVRRIGVWQRRTWHWQRVMGRPRSPTTNSARRATSRDYKLWVLRFWRRRAGRVWQQAKRPPHRAQWLCIHRYEGPWRATPGGRGALNSGGPYYGGLQMDLEFQRTYGRFLLRKKGTADRWSPLEQMWVAERAHRTRGFYPWPNTARWCGLI